MKISSQLYIYSSVRVILRNSPILYRLALFLYGLIKITLIFFFKERGYLCKILKGRLVIICISEVNINFSKELLDFFPYYDATIKVVTPGRVKKLDFTGPRQHLVSKFAEFPFWFPSVPEPIITIEQYLEILDLKVGEIVIDLGAYSGLSSIAFKNEVGKSGVVIAVEADPKNFSLCEDNLVHYEKSSNFKIERTHAAAFSTSGFMPFISEGTMASSLKQTSIDGWVRDKVMTEVSTITLEDIVKRFNLRTVDVIKADIEGSEFDVFSLASFFQKYRPRVLVEIPSLAQVAKSKGELNVKNTERNLFELFSSYDYKHCEYKQIGSNLPLVLFEPKGK